MPGAMRRRAFHPVPLLAAVALAGGGLSMLAAGDVATSETATVPAAEQVYSNIQVLRGTPAGQVLPTMDLISASVGVACEYCHVAGAFEVDDVPAKKTAREMVLMMRAINRDNFEGRRTVTCWSCHRGSPHPEDEPPPVAEGSPPRPSAWPAELEEVPGVTAEGVVARHVEAVGGSAAAAAIVGRVARGSATLFGGREFPVEIRQHRPLRHSMALELPGGARVSTLDGTAGLIETPGRPPLPMNDAEVAVAALAVDFHWLARPAETLTELRLAGLRRAGDRKLIVVEARIEGRPVELSFDRESGLLGRVTAWAETPLGRLLTEVSIDGYREVDGLKTPVAWTVARPGGRFTVRLDEIDQELAPAEGGGS